MITLTRKRLFRDSINLFETWLAGLSDEYILCMASDDHIRDCYEKMTELYVLHALPGVNDFVSAEQFLDMDEVLDDGYKKVESSLEEKECFSMGEWGVCMVVCELIRIVLYSSY